MASDLGISKQLVGRAATICRYLGKPPSQKRLCVCVMNHPDMGDDEIADLFGRSEKWVEQVRSEKVALRQSERFPDYLEYLDDGFQPSDPTPWELQNRRDSLKALWVDGVQGEYVDGVMPYGRAAARRDGDE